LERERRSAQEQLSKLGGSKAHDIKLIQEAMVRAEHEKEAAEKSVTDVARSLGICLAVSRLAPAIINRLEAEDLREKWERLREGAIDRSEQVIAVAMPEPAAADPLLGNIAEHTRRQVKDRFRKALEHIYNPPPTNCAAGYILGHAKGELRQKVMGTLARTRRLGSADIRNKCQRLKLARDGYEDAVARHDRLRDLPKEIEEHTEKLNGLNAQIAEAIKRLGAIDHEIKKLKGDHHALSAEIGRLQEEVAKAEPEQRRIAVAERVSRVLEELTEKLKPITISRLEDSVTTHFISIADKRFRGGHVRIPREGMPYFEWSDRQTQPIETMSGFERRSFGIAFSLALAEITKRRIPLIIDTPMGNADTAYRPRLLKAVTNVDLDQVIILTHDAEVAGNLLEEVEDQVCQEFLVKYEAGSKESVVEPDAYFDGVYA
jgi:DNA sulfur modification protein DndD